MYRNVCYKIRCFCIFYINRHLLYNQVQFNIQLISCFFDEVAQCFFLLFFMFCMDFFNPFFFNYFNSFPLVGGFLHIKQNILRNLLYLTPLYDFFFFFNLWNIFSIWISLLRFLSEVEEKGSDKWTALHPGHHSNASKFFNITLLFDTNQ